MLERSGSEDGSVAMLDCEFRQIMLGKVLRGDASQAIQEEPQLRHQQLK